MAPRAGTSRRFVVRAPATTANLGPGFDCLGLTLDLWNETEVALAGDGLSVSVDGEGRSSLPRDGRNVVPAMLLRRLDELGCERPSGLRLECRNRIPLDSGLGSSAAAVVTGLLAAETIAGHRSTESDVVRSAAAAEGHADNAAAAVLGGLTAVALDGDDLVWRSWAVPRLPVVVVTPEGHYSTGEARAALPAGVPLSAAVANLGRVPLVIEALRQGDLDLLGRVMVDDLHERGRLALTPGAAQAQRIARSAGAAAVAVSGSGPSLIAFVADDDRAQRVGDTMADVFASAGVSARVRRLTTITRGVHVAVSDADHGVAGGRNDAGDRPTV